MSEFVDHLLDLLQGFGEVRARRMFGGHGIFREGVMFALVADDTLYLKVDEHNRPDYEAHALPAFTYERAGKRIALLYFRIPDEALNGEVELRRWAEAAYRAALGR